MELPAYISCLSKPSWLKIKTFVQITCQRSKICSSCVYKVHVVCNFYFYSFYIFSFMCVCVLPACISVPLVCREARVGLRAPRAGSKIVVSSCSHFSTWHRRFYPSSYLSSLKSLVSNLPQSYLHTAFG